ncbi:MAG: hypothetical protein NVS1B14_03980 [Vulcanimicrobiaceae bacterium]
MLIFRSEEHVAKWCSDWRMDEGAIVRLGQCWKLAQAWYGPDRREAAWRRFTEAEAQALFDRVGLSAPFWRLTGSG